MFPASSKGGGFTVAFPDVCKTPTPAGPVPIPYPNIAKTAQEKQQGKKVKVGGKTVGMKNKSAFKTSTGNEAGTLKGLKAAEVMSLKSRLNSLNVKMQGLSPNQPELWQAALQDYAVTASALYTTLNPD